MVWVDKPGKGLEPVKHKGQCYNRSQWRYCPFWQQLKDIDTKQVIGYYCSLYQKNKPDGYQSLDECNEEWGETNVPLL